MDTLENSDGGEPDGRIDLSDLMTEYRISSSPRVMSKILEAMERNRRPKVETPVDLEESVADCLVREIHLVCRRVRKDFGLGPIKIVNFEARVLGKRKFDLTTRDGYLVAELSAPQLKDRKRRQQMLALVSRTLQRLRDEEWVEREARSQERAA